jgi:hypothetical protein
MCRLVANPGSTATPCMPSSSWEYTGMVPITLVLPAASVSRTVPLRAVCTTDRFGSTASDIGSPSSALPLARLTCW